MSERRLRTLFFGSSEFSVPSLRALLLEQDVVAICSQPDRPAGRGLSLRPTAVSLTACDAGKPLLTPAKLDVAFIQEVANLRPELLACASYGRILPAKLLAIQGMTALNLHPSLLPRYRGATPIQTALRDGCEQTGVTVFWMGPGLDDGDIALQRSMAILPTDNYGSLHDRLATVGAQLLAHAARQLAAGSLPRVPQPSDGASYTKPLSKADLRLHFAVPATAVVNQVRSLAPVPGAWMRLAGRRLKVLEASVASNGEPRGEPGTLVAYEECGPIIAASVGTVCLRTVVPEGRTKMSGSDFGRGIAQNA